MQEFNSFYPHLVLYREHREHFCSIWADLGNFFFLFHQKFHLLSYDLKNVFTKQVSKNAEAAVCKCSSEVATQRCSAKERPLEISQNLQKNICVEVPFNTVRGLKDYSFNKKGNPTQEFSCEYHKFLRIAFLWNISVGCFIIWLRNF